MAAIALEAETTAALEEAMVVEVGGDYWGWGGGVGCGGGVVFYVPKRCGAFKRSARFL